MSSKVIDEQYINTIIANKENALDYEDAISTSLGIINSLLNYANTLENLPETPFDLSQNGSTDSDGENKTVSAIEYYEFEDFLDHCVRYMGVDEDMIILSMMLLDKLHERNEDFHLSEKNVSK